MAKRTYEIMKGQGGPPQVTQSEPSDADYFSTMKWVVNRVTKLAGNEVQGDEKMYADARHITVATAPRYVHGG